jgi:elongation factor P hydroxylase
LHSSIFINIFLNQKLKIPYKFDFRLGLIDFEKIYFPINSRYGYLLIVFLRDLYSNYSLKLLLRVMFRTRKGSFRGEP